MKISNNYNTPNFKGFKNLISFNQEAQGNRLSMFAVQLDNEGTNDLDKYKKLAEYPRCFTKADIDDTIMCVYSENPAHRAMFLNNDILLNGHELEEVATKLDDDDFKQIETGYLKAYTLIADLTKRIISNNKPLIRDMSFQKVALQTQRMLTQLCGGDTSSAFQILQDACYNIRPPKTASIINAGINKALKNYF